MTKEKILNPKTGKMVNIDGKIGKELLKQKELNKRENKKLKDEVEKVMNYTKKKEEIIKNELLKKTEELKEQLKKKLKKEQEKEESIVPEVIKRIEIPKELKMMEIKIGIKKINNEKEKKKKTGMTLEKFENLVKNDKEFINNFRMNLINLCRYKRDIYSNIEMLPKLIQEEKKGGSGQEKNVYEKLLEKIIKLQNETKDIEFNNTLRDNLLDAINNKKYGMKTLIGREEIMNKLCSILYAFSKNYKLLSNTFINFAIFGSAGVGKSALAKVFAYTFKNSFILINGNVIIATRDELVGKYIGHTANKTRKLLFDGLEGILFLDEAYSLTPCPEAQNEKDFGFEAVAELINFMDKTIGLMVVMVAGYKDVMERCFFKSNEGLDRRFPNKIILRPYTNEELTRILLFNLKRADISVDQESANLLYSLITNLRKQEEKIFNNQAGDMLNLCNSIVQNIYMSEDNNWGNYRQNKQIIYDGFEEFLSNKGYFMRLE